MFVGLRLQTTNLRGHTITRRQNIAGVLVLDSAVARAAGASLGRSEGYEGREHGKRNQLLEGEHVSVQLRGVVLWRD